jgi:hypothetical protein
VPAISSGYSGAHLLLKSPRKQANQQFEQVEILEVVARHFTVSNGHTPGDAYHADERPARLSQAESFDFRKNL